MQKEFIFIGEKPSDAYLTYLPFTGMKRESTIEEEMKKLLTDIAGEVEGLQGNEFKSILNYIKNPAFGLPGLKKLLLELISLRSNVNQNQDMYNNNPNANFADNRNPGINQNNYQPIKPPEQVKEVVNKSKKKAKGKLPPLSSRGRIYLIMGSLLAIALIWKLYDMYTNQTMLIVSSLLTIFVLVFDYVFWRVWRPGVAPIEAKVEVPNNSSENKAAMPNVQINKQPVFQRQVAKQHEPIIAQTPSFIAQNSMAATAMDTTLLTESNEDTVLLEDEMNLHVVESQSQQAVSAILVRESADEQAQTIEINANNFLIGRNEASVNFKDESIGISRIHAEIIRIDDSSFGLKDLGSKNGSKLNGNTLVPYKIYALNEDDQFELGKATYTFKWSHS
ncbi:FHA domain-containing protein [Oceanobacillus sp. 143]|nr:FHA domain-containing protein [Oceanobacillus sp. 143]